MCATMSYYLRYNAAVKFARFAYSAHKMLIVGFDLPNLTSFFSFLGRSLGDHSTGTQHTRHMEPFATLR